jgi:arylsulfatase A-like enzyme
MPRTKPNILLISTDEHRFDCLGCYGNPVIRTPHIDAIAAGGVRFARAYVQNPMCMPSRMSIMTGRYPSEHGCNINCVGLPPHEQARTLMQVLRDAGYHTAACGKMHMMPKWGPFGFSYLDLVEGKADRNNQYTDYLEARGWAGRQRQPKGEAFPFDTHTVNLPAGETIDAFIGRRTVRWLEDWSGEQPTLSL